MVTKLMLLSVVAAEAAEEIMHKSVEAIRKFAAAQIDAVGKRQ